MTETGYYWNRDWLRAMASFFVILAVASFVFSGCRETRGKFETSRLPNQVIRNFELEESVSGRRLYRLAAGLATVWEADGRIDVETVAVIFYAENEEPYSQLTADAGTVWMRSEDLVARGNVCVITRDSMILRTESLAWNNSRRMIHTQADIVIETPSGWISGTGLVADAQLDRIEILSEVRGSSSHEFQP